MEQPSVERHCKREQRITSFPDCWSQLSWLASKPAQTCCTRDCQKWATCSHQSLLDLSVAVASCLGYLSRKQINLARYQSYAGSEACSS